MQPQHYDHQGSGHGFPTYATPADATLPSTNPALPYAPLPKRRGAGPTVLLTVAALVIPALIFGIPALAGGGDDGGETSSVTEDGSRESENDQDDEQARDERGNDDQENDEQEYDEQEVDGPTLEGGGYVYAVPAGWQKATGWGHDLAGDSVDSAIKVTRPDNGFETNVLVTAQDAGGAQTVDEAWETWLPTGGETTQLEPTSIDGVRALGLRNETRNEYGREVIQVGYLALWNERLYSIVLSAPVGAEGTGTEVFETVLDTWTWSDATDYSAA
jgi:hypothetical protein